MFCIRWSDEEEEQREDDFLQVSVTQKSEAAESNLITSVNNRAAWSFDCDLYFLRELLNVDAVWGADSFSDGVF